MIWVLILSAGESKRMGQAKQLLPYREKTILENILENCLSSKANNVKIVLGAHKEKIRELIRRYPVSFVYNSRYQMGMLSSVQCGIKSLPPDTKAFIVALSDQPGIPGEVIDCLIQAYDKSKKGIIIPVYSNKRGHPILIDIKYQEEIQKLSSEIGLRGLIFNHPDDILEVTVDHPNILKDIDTPNDYKNSQQQ